MATAARFMVPELRAERERSSLDLQELTTLLDGGKFVTKRRLKACKWMKLEVIESLYYLW